MPKLGRPKPGNAAAAPFPSFFFLPFSPLPLYRRAPHRIPRAHEHGEYQHRAANINNRPHIRHRQSRIIDIDKIIHDSGSNIRHTQGIQIASVQTGDIARNDASGENAKVLETVLLGPFGANDGLGTISIVCEFDIDI